ncbi:MAG TPA: winged helix-turn-helix domain-containing protein, partial [Flavisolibacter sp.]|nr:winged helix-turn-helix domain-containing protein [Flavisolibacter sp.]
MNKPANAENYRQHLVIEEVENITGLQNTSFHENHQPKSNHQSAMTTCILDDYVYLDDYSVTPRYQQLATSILTAVEQRVLQPGDMLPSINEVCVHYDISKGTVTKAYKELQQKGVIVSSPRKQS